MFLLTTQYLSGSRLIFTKTKGWQRNTRQPFLTFLWGLRKSSAVLNLILSVPLTARGDSARGFVSTADPSLKAKMKRGESQGELQKSKSGSASPVWQRQNTFFSPVWFYFTLFGLWQQMTTKGIERTCCYVNYLHTQIQRWQSHTEDLTTYNHMGCFFFPFCWLFLLL